MNQEHNCLDGFCFVNGSISRISVNHPRFIRHAGDGSKLISSNDTSGFTFRGRFVTSNQATEIGFDVTQKAHNTLRWLIARQGQRTGNGEQCYVSWAVSGKPIPKPTDSSWDLLGEELLLEDELHRLKRQRTALITPATLGPPLQTNSINTWRGTGPV